MKPKPIRLSIVLFIYGAVVILSMVTITVLFSLMNEKSARRSAMNLLQTALRRTVEIVENYLRSYEDSMKQAVLGSKRFNASRSLLGSSANITACAPAWSAMTVSLLDRRNTLTVFEMWRKDSHSSWDTAGCSAQKGECYYYSAERNETTIVPSDTRTATYEFDKAVVHPNRLPDLYPRHMTFLGTNIKSLPRTGLWSPMYLDFTNSSSDLETTHTCDNADVSATMTFYYCVDWLSYPADEPVHGECLHVAAARLLVSHLGDLDDLQLTPESRTYALSVFVHDFSNGSCLVPMEVDEIFTTFIVGCGVELPLGDGGNISQRKKVMTDACRRQELLTYDSSVVAMAASAMSDTGVFIVLIDIVPRSYFFRLIDQVKHVSIAISTTVCVVVVIVSVLSWIAIVVPIHWISHGLHKASTLASEPSSMARKAARYTFIHEVNILYKSYLELRTALTELKAFVPQGLLVAPNPSELYSDAMLLALFGSSSPSSGGRGNLTGNPQRGTDALSDSDSGSGGVADGLATSTSSAASGAPSPPGSASASTNSSLPFSPASARRSGVEVPIIEPPMHGRLAGQRRPMAPGSSLESGVAGSGLRVLPQPGAMSATSPTRSPTLGSTGIVRVFPISQTEAMLGGAGGRRSTERAPTHELLRDAGLLEAGAGDAMGQSRSHARASSRRRHRHRHSRKGSSKAGERPGGVPAKPAALSSRGGAGEFVKDELRVGGDGPSLVTPSALGFAAKGKGKGKGRSRGRTRGPGSGPTWQDADMYVADAAASGTGGRFGRSDTSMGGAHDSPSAASLELNLNHSGINTFRHVTCSFVVMSFSFRYANTEALEAALTELMDVIVKVVLRCGGVIEVFRPDLIAVSFGAHASMNRHAQLATLCAVTLMKKIPPKRRRLTRIIVDSGTFYVGNCGAHGRTARVVFGERFNFAIDLMKFELGLGRLLCTDRIAGMLPPSFVVPVDCIVPLRNRVHSIQLFQVLNPALRHDAAYREAASQFRSAYGAAVSGDLTGALAMIEKGRLFDPELAQYFATALRYLQSLKPPRPRYCRFQLPSFETLGSDMRERAPKYLYEKLALADIDAAATGGGQHGNDTLPSINFGFGDASGSGPEDTIDPDNLSRAFFQRSPNGSQGGRTSEQAAQSGGQDGLGGASGGGGGGGISASPSGPGSTVHDGVASGADGGGNSGGGFGFAMFSGSISSVDLPAVIVDHKGESWYRMPNPIGSGAFAEVHKALSSSGVLMALKCIQLSSTNVQLADVVSEVNTACKLFNDHIVNYTGWAHVGSFLVIIMDFMAGGSLHAALSAFPHGMPVHLARRCASDALKGLAYLHRNGVVHADIKPQNMLLAADGSCRLGDFGSSVSKANAFACGGDVFNLRGTPQYMSPEVAAGDTPTMASDLFSFGVALFEMLTGRRPWKQRGVSKPPERRRASMPTGIYIASPDTTAVEGCTSPARASPLAGATEAVDGATPPCSGGPLEVGPIAAHPAERQDDSPLADARPPASPVSTLNPAAAAAAAAGAAAAVTSVGDAADGETSCVSPTASEEVVETFHEVVGVSDVRFTQGLATGAIVPHFEPEELPTREAYELLRRCLSVDPAGRPSAAELIDHVFFLL